MQDKIEQDLKSALLASEKDRVSVLRVVKSALLNEAIAQGARDTGLSDDQVIKVLARESKKRAEAAELYHKGGADDRAEAEIAEKAIIDAYLPKQMDETQVAKIVDEVIAKNSPVGVQDMGRLIGVVRAQVGPAADGALIARLVKERLNP